MDSSEFTLLYNVLGYERYGTKKAFVRSTSSVKSILIGNESRWFLRNEYGSIVQSGKLLDQGYSFGMQLWSSDFSCVAMEGKYFLHVVITDAKGNQIWKDTSEPFYIQHHIYSQHLLTPLTVYNAQARIASEQEGGGYYDCNSRMGEARSHGIFLNGLVQAYTLGKDKFLESHHKELHNFANIAFDYLLSLHSEKTGEFAPAHSCRPNVEGNLWAFNSYEALYGFSAYLHLMADTDPERANLDNYHRAEKSAEYVIQNFTDDMAEQFGYPQREFMVAVYYHLYCYARDPKWKDKGIALMEKILESLNLRKTCRESRHAIPMLEGIYYFMKEFPKHPRYSVWMEHLQRIKDLYYKVLPERNAFSIMPISDASRTVIEWDDMQSLPGNEQVYGNNEARFSGNKSGASRQFVTRRAANAMDACFIGELTGDDLMEEIATGELGYVCGINPGFKQRFVENPPTTKKTAACALIANMCNRHATCWKRWFFEPKNSKWMSIMNGFLIENGEYYYEDTNDDSWWYSETFIKHDGAYAYAYCIYENYIDNLQKRCHAQGTKTN